MSLISWVRRVITLATIMFCTTYNIYMYIALNCCTIEAPYAEFHQILAYILVENGFSTHQFIGRYRLYDFGDDLFAA